jgi:hypothetical protein
VQQRRVADHPAASVVVKSLCDLTVVNVHDKADGAKVVREDAVGCGRCDRTRGWTDVRLAHDCAGGMLAAAVDEAVAESALSMQLGDGVEIVAVDVQGL